MKIPQSYIQSAKAGIHISQAFLIFIAACLSLAVLTKAGTTGAQVGYYFGLCFLSIPALIYQIMVPVWTRAWRFANPYAYAIIDLLYALLWFAAFVSVATWQAQGIREGDKNSNTNSDNGDGSCDKFAYGSATKCSTSKASVGFGAVIFLLFAATSAISVNGAWKYKRTGVYPNSKAVRSNKSEPPDMEDPHKDPWSADIDDLNHRPSTNRWNSDETDQRKAYGQMSDEDEQMLLRRTTPSNENQNPFDTNSTHDTITDDGLHPGRALSFDSAETLNTAASSYKESQLNIQTVGTDSPTGYIPPSALSPTKYGHSSEERLDFPQAHYEAVDFR